MRANRAHAFEFKASDLSVCLSALSGAVFGCALLQSQHGQQHLEQANYDTTTGTIYRETDPAQRAARAGSLLPRSRAFRGFFACQVKNGKPCFAGTSCGTAKLTFKVC